MDRVNRPVIIGAVLISVVGVVRVWIGQATPGMTATQILIAGNVLILILAGVDMIPGIGAVVSALAMLAVVSVLLNSGLITWVASLAQPKKAA